MSATDLDAALGARERILLDSSALIAFHSPHEAAHPLAAHLLRRIEDDGDLLVVYYSTVTAVELLIRPIRAGLQQFGFMHTFLAQYPHLTGLPLDLTVAVHAATVRSATGVALPDAIVIAAGMLAGCEAVVSNDREWSKKVAPFFRQFQWLCLSDFLDQADAGAEPKA